MRLILASSCLQKKDLLSHIGYKVNLTITPDINKASFSKEPPEKLAARLAIEKCRKVAMEFPNDIIIATDTVVEKGRREILKPVNMQQAEEVLKLLSGGRYRVITGVCIKVLGKEITKTVLTKLKFKKLSQEEINIILKSKEWQSKSARLLCLGLAAAYVTWLSGSHSNVMGLPLAETHKMLQGFGLKQNSAEVQQTI